MRQIVPLNIDNNTLLENVIKYKHNTAKTQLSSVLSTIESDYQIYDTNKYSLETVCPDTTVKAQREYLQDCYKRGTEISKIKQRIKDNMPEKIKGKCPYCMISEPNTIDHYLNKDEFPEYSIYTDNLIPCCSYCNGKKSNLWIHNGKRIFLNSYFDSPIEDEYLFVSVDIKDDTPYIKDVKIDFSNVTASGLRIDMVRSHYEKLNLLKRYKDKSIGYLSTIVYELIEPSRQPLKACTDSLERRINALEKNNGFNHWETAVCRGILNNPKVMDWVSDNYKSIYKIYS